MSSDLDLWKEVLHTVTIFLRKSDKPLATAVVLWKLLILCMIKWYMHLGFSGLLKHVLSLTKLLESQLVKNSDKKDFVSSLLKWPHQQGKTFHMCVYKCIKPNLHI